MLRTILLFIVFLILIVIVLVATGTINLYRSDNGVAIETRDVDVGTTVTNVKVPVVRMEERAVEVPAVTVENKTAPSEPVPEQ